MLFQGQEFGASTPFLYFADHEGELAQAVRRGRAEFVSQFPSMATGAVQRGLPPPHEQATFVRCKLRWEERRSHAAHLRLHEDLLAMRRGDLAFRQQSRGAVDGAVLAAQAFVLRFFTADVSDERLVVVNLGSDLTVASLAEPLVAPPHGGTWRNRWSSESVEYGGIGAADVVTPDGWRIPGQSCTVLAAVAV
jgi:maltooligosyltrehalose trehalohydrolase